MRAKVKSKNDKIDFLTYRKKEKLGEKNNLR
jgi:hypothetical protein